MGLWLTLFIISSVLPRSISEKTSEIPNEGAGEPEDVYHLRQSFNCSDRTSIDITNSESALRSLTLTSPFYGNAPSNNNPNNNVLACTINILNIPNNMWIGMFFNMNSSTSTITDRLRIDPKNPATLFSKELSGIGSGYIYHYTTPSQTASLSITLTRGKVSTGTNSGQSQDYQFALDIKLAYPMGRTFNNMPEISHRQIGFMVSHRNFDNGTDDANYYTSRIDEKILFTTEEYVFVRLTFLAFNLHRSYAPIYGFCDDYLEINGINGGTMYFCGYDYLTGSYVDLYPSDESVTLRFITRTLFFKSNSAGFLIKFIGIGPESAGCPPSIQNAQLTEISNKSYIIECQEGYWTGINSSQIVNCSDKEWRTDIKPCIRVECELPEISNSSEVNFTLSSRGRATVGINISYSCNSKRYELTDGTEISTCTSNGEWSSPTPNCTLIVIATTETTPTNTEPSRYTTEGNTTTMDSKQETESTAKTASSASGYIGGGVGAAIVVTLIVVVVLLLLRRRKSRKKNYPETVVSGDVTESHPSTQNGDGGIYYLADDEQSSPNPGKKPLPEVYELAGPMEELDGNRSADSSNSVSEETVTFISPRPAAAASVGAYVDVDVSAGVYSLANEDDADAATITRQPGSTTYDEYELAGPMDAYENANVIERAQQEKDISDAYDSILGDRKTKKSGSTTDVMVDNELYGT